MGIEEQEQELQNDIAHKQLIQQIVDCCRDLDIVTIDQQYHTDPRMNKEARKRLRNHNVIDLVREYFRTKADLLALPISPNAFFIDAKMSNYIEVSPFLNSIADAQSGRKTLYAIRDKGFWIDDTWEFGRPGIPIDESTVLFELTRSNYEQEIKTLMPKVHKILGENVGHYVSHHRGSGDPCLGIDIAIVNEMRPWKDLIKEVTQK